MKKYLIAAFLVICLLASFGYSISITTEPTPKQITYSSPKKEKEKKEPKEPKEKAVSQLVITSVERK